jgi:hypothetical protein
VAVKSSVVSVGDGTRVVEVLVPSVEDPVSASAASTASSGVDGLTRSVAIKEVFNGSF